MNIKEQLKSLGVLVPNGIVLAALRLDLVLKEKFNIVIDKNGKYNSLNILREILSTDLQIIDKDDEI